MQNLELGHSGAHVGRSGIYEAVESEFHEPTWIESGFLCGYHSLNDIDP